MLTAVIPELLLDLVLVPELQERLLELQSD
jgi:hypothetical protein